MNDLYKGYIKTKNKQAAEKFKDRTDFKTLEQVQSLPEYAGILVKNTMFIDIDDPEQSEILMDIVEEFQLNCRVICTRRGKHFIFRNTQLHQCKTHTRLAIGLTADIKVGYVASYEVLKTDGEERFCEWDVEPGVEYQEVPKWLLPVGKIKAEFLDMAAGDGRNQELFNYILRLQSNDYSVEETREAIRIINRFVLKDPLSDQEIETILRDDAFKKPVFFNGSTFLFNKFADYIRNTDHIIKISGKLHIYREGIYISDTAAIFKVMRSYIPAIRKNQKAEVMDCLNDNAEEKQPADARYVAFKNGIYDVVTDTMQDFSPNIVMTNKIPWDYNSAAFSELADHTLNRLACDDPAIRSLLEECIGYCFYRSNAYKSSFMLTGDKDNGKSTFLDLVKAVLGEDNISALDAKELGDRFTTSMMFGKLANIGDDISDDFMQGSQVSIFKKIVTGNRIKAERKGQDPFEFNPYIKLLFSANDIPRMKDKTGAVLRRLVIIPFNAHFTSDLPDYDPEIKKKLLQSECMEYLIKLGIEGLKRITENKGFTRSEATEQAAHEYDLMNDPIKAFFSERDEGYLFRETVTDVYAAYKVYCNESGINPETKIMFGKSVADMFGVETYPTRVGGQQVRRYRKK